MKQKIAHLIADFLVAQGIEDNFTVTGGGAMHLNDALGHHPGLHTIYNHHEQASAIAAESYARMTGKMASLCVTSGPGGTNAITGVMGGWLDSIPMFVLSGQVKRETTIWSTPVPLRQLGDQEFNIVDSVKNMTKYAVMITEPTSIRYHLEKAFYLATNGRPGPVWLDIPLDIQAAIVETDELAGFSPDELDTPLNPTYDENLTPEILSKIAMAKKPCILVGTGVHLSGMREELSKLVSQLSIPVVTAWNSNDLIADANPCFCGRPGTIGVRGGNFVVQGCDLLLVLGCRMNIRIISYNYRDFAKDAFKIVVDIDENELKKPTVTPDMPIHANCGDVIPSLLRALEKSTNTYAIGAAKNADHKAWLDHARKVFLQYPATMPEYYAVKQPMNPYAFVTEFSKLWSDDETVICGNGSACVMTFQSAVVKEHQRLYTNSGCAAMGYGFPAAIGAAVANKGKRVICIDGDGSFQMNLQELATVGCNKMNIKIVYLNNEGYHSIRQTQTNFFQPPLLGIGVGSGLTFPSPEKLAAAYDIPFVRLDNLDDVKEITEKLLSTEGPIFCEVVVDPKQNFSPKLSSKVLPDGKIVSPSLDDMFPFLEREEYEVAKRLETN